MRQILSVLSLLLIITSLTSAQDAANWQFAGQVQMRSELDGRDFNSKTYMPFMSVMRTRLSAAKTFEQKVEFFLQAQDSRVLGQNGSPSNYAANLDLFQGYIKLNKLFDLPMDVQAGRFVMSYGTERFIGASNWSYTGRSFDGVRLSFNVPGKLDVFGVTNNDKRKYISNATDKSYPAAIPADNTSSLYGIWYNTKQFNSIDLDAFVLYDINRTKSNSVDRDAKVATIGTTVQYNQDMTWLTFEGAFQTGSRGAKDVAAYLISLSGNYKVNMHKLGLGADIISGTDDQIKDNNVFSTSYGTNHKFYGSMDYFTDFYANTYGLGMMDFYAMWDILPRDYAISGSVYVHHFITAVKPSVGDGAFGQEIDLTLKYQVVKGTTLTWGGSIFFPGEFMKNVFMVGSLERKDPGFWSYLMITANF